MQLNVREAATALKVSTKTIYRWMRERKIPGYRVNRSFRFDRAELLEWASACRLDVSVGFLDEPRDIAPLPTFDKALEQGGLYYRIEGVDRDSVLRGAVDAIRLGNDGDRDLVLAALCARENLASTAIGDGVALPHLRNPLRLQLESPSVSLCLLERPVDWHALDGVPVSVLFVVLAPTVRGVLQLHSRTFFALRDPAFRAVVMKQGSRESILAEARRVARAFADRGTAGQ